MHSFSKNIGQETKEYQHHERINGYKNFVHRYFHDEKYAKRFSSVGSFWEARFHEQMLNPRNSNIDLSKKNYFMLPNFISLLSDYFRVGEGEDGSYISDDPNLKVSSIKFTGTNLSYKESNQQISSIVKVKSFTHLYSNLAYFISKNPAILSLDLTDTKLTDKGAQKIADALEKNNRLLYITLENNPDIKPATLERIEQLLEKNRGLMLGFNLGVAVL